jgi:phage baseplate assembly protein V
MIELINAIASLRSRFFQIFKTAKVLRQQEEGKFQTFQLEIEKGEIKDNVKRVQDYGFTSSPPENSEAYVLFNGGIRDNGYIFKIDNQNWRLKKLKTGEVALYTDQDIIHLKRGNIDIKTKNNVFIKNSSNEKVFSIDLEKKQMKFSGDIEVTGDIIDKHGKIKKIREVFNQHTHSTPQGTTSSPSKQMEVK